jgi:hypothetical protein
MIKEYVSLNRDSNNLKAIAKVLRLANNNLTSK